MKISLGNPREDNNDQVMMEVNPNNLVHIIQKLDQAALHSKTL